MGPILMALSEGIGYHCSGTASEADGAHEASYGKHP